MLYLEDPNPETGRETWKRAGAPPNRVNPYIEGMEEEEEDIICINNTFIFLLLLLLWRLNREPMARSPSEDGRGRLGWS